MRGLTKRYLGLTAVDDLSFSVEAGAIVGIIGPNGSGKSTSIDCLTGFQRAPTPATGSSTGRELPAGDRTAIARAGLIRTFQNVRAYDEMTLLDNLCVASQEQ